MEKSGFIRSVWTGRRYYVFFSGRFWGRYQGQFSGQKFLFHRECCPQVNFCLLFYPDRSAVGANACTASRDAAKFEFFPYLMTISAFFLLVTVGVYTLYPKIMTSKVHLLRRHFAVNMLLAYVFLSIIQFKEFKVIFQLR